ncbi:hypothetical protein BDP27DRAFT_1515389 [Rhodocollybia butyracea]|uniref:Uncharacterized protein n=1 Tax=Rhodocollybia butyracea TaxID=206335 RepID=A0A9P5TX61_9AGAR|nr:hypothetical protein BDP27DRAFT_1515389 [Rhodocollybia butyracea]
MAKERSIPRRQTPEWAWLRNVGKDIFDEGKTLLTIMHLSCWTTDKADDHGFDHWVPLIIDGAGDEFLYGDSLAMDTLMPPKLTQPSCGTVNPKNRDAKNRVPIVHGDREKIESLILTKGKKRVLSCGIGVRHQEKLYRGTRVVVHSCRILKGSPHYHTGALQSTSELLKFSPGCAYVLMYIIMMGARCLPALAICQVDVKTQGVAFLSDFQGSGELRTDAQTMTSPINIVKSYFTATPHVWQRHIENYIWGH